MTQTNQTIVRTTTNNLKVGDILQHGNMFIGFTYTTVMALEAWDNEPEWKRRPHNKIRVMEKFESGAVGGYWSGKNATWDVVKESN